MPNLDRSFEIVGAINSDRGGDQENRPGIGRVNKVQIDFHENKVIVGIRRASLMCK